jgi:hypothetical protein
VATREDHDEWFCAHQLVSEVVACNSGRKNAASSRPFSNASANLGE